MSWRDNLLPASFRGVRFEVESHDSDVGGRRVALHEYPNRDRPWAEDMGKRADGFEIDAYVIGDDYMAQRDALIRACAQAGPGILVHPYLGERSVMCEGCRVSERSDAGRMAGFELRFVESGRAEYPAPSPDTNAIVKAAAAAAGAAAVERFTAAWEPDMPGWAAAALADDVRAAADGMGSASLAAKAGALVRDAAGLAAAVSEAMDGASGLAALAAAPLAGRPAIPLTTASRRLQAANRAALAALLGERAAIRLAEVAATASYTDRDAAAAARDRVADALDSRAATASDEVFASLRRLRGDALDAIAAKLTALPAVVRATPARVAPSLVLAYDWYGDLDRAAEIAARAGAARPGFLPAAPIRVLSS